MEEPMLTDSVQVTLEPKQNFEQSLNISDNEEEIVFFKSKKKVMNLSDSESDTPPITSTAIDNNSDSERSQHSPVKTSRIKIKPLNTSESEDSDSDKPNTIQKSVRIKDRDEKFVNKFKKSFMKKINKRKSDNTNESISNNIDSENSKEPTNTYADHTNVTVPNTIESQNSKLSGLIDSDSSDEEQPNKSVDNTNLNTIDSQKSKITGLFDSESSDGEPAVDEGKRVCSDDDKNENVSKSKMPQRMSAKQAMEQMQKIKSESSRMLREKRFHLPYHRPKQISLKDIMNKKKIEFNPGAKKLTLRMNEEQLMQYAKQLEEKEKEMIELYKNESDEEIVSESKDSLNAEDKSMNMDTEDVNNQPMQNPSNNSKLQPSEIPTVDTMNQTDGDKNENIHKITSTEENVDIDSSLTDLLKETVDFVNNYDKNKDDTNELTVSQPVCRKISDLITCSLPIKPTLSGAPGTFIDLTPDTKEELSGVDILKKKYLFHSSMKTPEELEREQESKIMPGKALMNLRRELEEKISQKRVEEWNKKREEDLLKKKEDNELDDELSECEQILEKETEPEIYLDKDDDDDSIESEPELLDEEDEVDIKSDKKPKNKCDLIEDEAELDDDDPSSDEEDEDESDDDITKPTEVKKPLTRIYKAFSESSDDEESQNKNNSLKKIDVMSTPMKTIDTERDIFDSQDTNIESNGLFTIDSDDYIPSAQKFIDESPLTCRNRSNDKLDCTPIEFNDKIDFLSTSFNETPFRDTTPIENHSPLTPDYSNLHKNPFIDPSSLDIGTQNTQEIADLCSGKFPTQSTDDIPFENLDSVLFSKENMDTEMSQNTEMELLELCTGKFKGVNTQSTENLAENVSNSSVFENNIGSITDEFTPQSNPAMENDVSTTNSTENANITSKCQVVKCDNIIFSVKAKKCDIKSFFLPKSIDKNIERNVVQSETMSEKCEDIPIIEEPVSPPRGKFAIVSSSDENNDEITSVKNKVLLSVKERNKKLRAKPLEISDDESDDESDDSNASFTDVRSNASIKNDDKDVEYDSEENEIEIIAELELPAPKQKKTSEFFDHEAEMTSEDEWKGSGDEDERGLDELESEDGDADDIDQRKVNKELERIHRHQMLDQDKKEIKLLQDILLDDGDLEGGTRERKFKWKNVDDTVESGAIVGDENPDENFDDIQSEEQWRKQRHERETFLREMMEKENLKKSDTAEPISNTNVRMSIIKGTLNSNLKFGKWNSASPKLRKDKDETCVKNKLGNTPEIETNVTKKNSAKDLPSPVKTPLSLIKPGFKGSFLMRGQAALNRLALLTKNGGDDDTNRNLNSKRGNFVFTTISPPCNKVTVDEDTKKTKRKASLPTTPLLIKKVKLSEDNNKFKKSLFDHIE